MNKHEARAILLLAVTAILAVIVSATFSAARAAEVGYSYAFVVPTKMTPLANGVRVTPMIPVEVPFDDCEIEADKAIAAMQAGERLAAEALGFMDWTPGSTAYCKKKRWVVQFTTTVTVASDDCPIEWTASLDWSLALQACLNGSAP